MNKSYYKETRINTILKGEIGKKNLGKIEEEDQGEKEKKSGGRGLPAEDRDGQTMEAEDVEGRGGGGVVMER